MLRVFKKLFYLYLQFIDDFIMAAESEATGEECEKRRMHLAFCLSAKLQMFELNSFTKVKKKRFVFSSMKFD